MVRICYSGVHCQFAIATPPPPTASASLYLCALQRRPSVRPCTYSFRLDRPTAVSPSAAAAVAVGDGGRGLLFLPSFLPSFFPPLSNVCESRTDRASERASGREGGRTTRLYPRASGLQFHRAISLDQPSLLLGNQITWWLHSKGREFGLRERALLEWTLRK